MLNVTVYGKYGNSCIETSRGGYIKIWAVTVVKPAGYGKYSNSSLNSPYHIENSGTRSVSPIMVNRIPCKREQRRSFSTINTTFHYRNLHVIKCLLDLICFLQNIKADQVTSNSKSYDLSSFLTAEQVLHQWFLNMCSWERELELFSGLRTSVGLSKEN